MKTKMKRYCTVCGEPIPEGRLKAFPNASTCTKHSNAEKVAGFPLITGKTTYSELEIVSQEEFKQLNKKMRRTYCRGKCG